MFIRLSDCSVTLRVWPVGPSRLQDHLPLARLAPLFPIRIVMKKLPAFFAALALLAAVFAGCSTFESRSREKAATFASLSPAEREKLKHGVIELGNTPDMVYIALGHPDERHESTNAQRRRTVWVYNSYFQDYEGSFHTGYRRFVVYDPIRKRYNVFFEPTYTDVYSEHEEERIRITFENGHVIAIEQPKSPA